MWKAASSWAESASGAGDKLMSVVAWIVTSTHCLSSWMQLELRLWHAEKTWKRVQIRVKGSKTLKGRFEGRGTEKQQTQGTGRVDEWRANRKVKKLADLRGVICAELSLLEGLRSETDGGWFPPLILLSVTVTQGLQAVCCLCFHHIWHPYATGQQQQTETGAYIVFI